MKFRRWLAQWIAGNDLLVFTQDELDFMLDLRTENAMRYLELAQRVVPELFVREPKERLH